MRPLNKTTGATGLGMCLTNVVVLLCPPANDAGETGGGPEGVPEEGHAEGGDGNGETATGEMEEMGAEGDGNGEME